MGKNSWSKEDITKAEVHRLQVDDIEIAYKTFGEGEPLLLITGFSGTMDLWAPEVLAQLAQHYQVIIFDNRGMGLTTASDKEFTIELFAEDTAGLLDALKLERAHVLGWSLGTNMAQELALNHPDKVDKLILYAADCGGKDAIDPPTWVMDILNDPSATPEQMLSTLFPKKWLEEHPDPTEYFPIPTEESSPENVQRQYDAWRNWSGTYSRLPQISQPTLLITGAEDVCTPWQNSLIMVNRIPGDWLVQIQGAGHGLMYQYPEKFSQVLLTFLQS